MKYNPNIIYHKTRSQIINVVKHHNSNSKNRLHDSILRHRLLCRHHPNFIKNLQIQSIISNYRINIRRGIIHQCRSSSYFTLIGRYPLEISTGWWWGFRCVPVGEFVNDGRIFDHCLFYENTELSLGYAFSRAWSSSCRFE